MVMMMPMLIMSMMKMAVIKKVGASSRNGRASSCSHASVAAEQKFAKKMQKFPDQHKFGKLGVEGKYWGVERTGKGWVVLIRGLVGSR